MVFNKKHDGNHQNLTPNVPTNIFLLLKGMLLVRESTNALNNLQGIVMCPVTGGICEHWIKLATFLTFTNPKLYLNFY